MSHFSTFQPVTLACLKLFTVYLVYPETGLMFSSQHVVACYVFIIPSQLQLLFLYIYSVYIYRVTPTIKAIFGFTHVSFSI